MVKRPTLIVLHGGPGFDHASLRPYFDRFSDSHQVIYLDHRGNGRFTMRGPSGASADPTTSKNSRAPLTSICIRPSARRAPVRSLVTGKTRSAIYSVDNKPAEGIRNGHRS